MTLMTRLTSVDFGFAVKAAAVGIAITLTTFPHTASAKTVTIHGEQFKQEWYDANKENYDYTPLKGAEQHYDNVVGLSRMVSALNIKKSYCKPPLRPQKAKDRRLLDEFAKILRKRQSAQAYLAPIAALVPQSRLSKPF